MIAYLPLLHEYIKKSHLSIKHFDSKVEIDGIDEYI